MTELQHNRTLRGAPNAEMPRIQSPARPIQAGEHAPVREVL